MTTDRRNSSTDADLDVTFSVGGPEVTWREVDGEIVVLDLDGSVYFGLNSAGADLWKQLADGAVHRDLTSALAASGQLTKAAAGADVDTFLAELQRCGLLHQN